MNPITVFGKTQSGREQLAARTIPLALRHALILVDGRSTLTEVLKKGEGLPQLADSLEQLAKRGLIAPVDEAGAAPHQSTFTKPTAGSLSVKLQLIALARNLLDNQADKVIRRIEETDDSNAALVHAITACGKVIKLTIDEGKSVAFVVSANDILAKHAK